MGPFKQLEMDCVSCREESHLSGVAVLERERRKVTCMIFAIHQLTLTLYTALCPHEKTVD